MADMLYIRDTIEVNAALAGRIPARAVAPGDTLRLVARSIRHDAGYVLQLPGSHVLVVAQDYDGNGGGIEVTGKAGTTGSDGQPGAVVAMGQHGKPGGDGSPGGDGAPGGSVRVLCEHFHTGKFWADGGSGGDGGTGGHGGNGGVGRPSIPRKTQGMPPGAGGRGGNGGHGGDGAAGGSVTVTYIQADSPPASSATGGAAGHGGNAGAGGLVIGRRLGLDSITAGVTQPDASAGASTSETIASDVSVAAPVMPRLPIGGRNPRPPVIPGGHIPLPPVHPGGNIPLPGTGGSGTGTGGTGSGTGGSGTGTGGTGSGTGGSGTGTGGTGSGTGGTGIPELPVRAGAPGTAGDNGKAGAAGSTATRRVSKADYWATVQQTLGADATRWADARLASGEFFYRRANVPPDGAQANLSLATNEFDRVLELRPSDAAAAQFGKQITANQNVLGLANDLDVTPDFDRYIQAYTAWGTLVFGVFNQGIESLLTATSIGVMTRELAMHVSDVDAAITDATADHATAVAGQQTAAQQVTFATQKAESLTQQIQAAKTAMEHQSLSFGDIVTTVAKVAGAVVSILGAIPTLGASLVALVPDCAWLAETVFADGPALIGQLFGDGSVPTVVKDAYAKAGKDIAGIGKAGSAVVNLVDVINKLDKAKTEANAKYTALVKQGVEAAHAVMLAQLGQHQADLQVAAVQVRIDQAQQLKKTCLSLMAADNADANTIRSAGQALIDAAGLQRDRLLSDAFHAQRAVEIYTGKDESAAVRMDSGSVAPDVLADYHEGFLPLTQMTAAYSASWALLMAPAVLQNDYVDYFDGLTGQQDLDWYRITVTDNDQIAQFRSTRSLAFGIDLDDLPPGRIATKIQSPAVAFVGAKSPSGVTSCEVWHGPEYTQLKPDGTVDVQLLRPHTDAVSSPLTRLADAGVNLTPGDALTEPTFCPIWGRGMGGQWNVTVPDVEVDRYGTDLDTLTEIDIWIAYTFSSPQS